MRKYIEISTLSFDAIRNFINETVRRDDWLFCMGKAQAYIEAAYVCEWVTPVEAVKLLAMVDRVLAVKG